MNEIIDTVRYCETNKDIYCVVKEESNGFYYTYWLQIGISSCHYEDIINDREIGYVPKLGYNTQKELKNILRSHKIFTE